MTEDNNITVKSFRVNAYVLFFSLFALVFGSYADLLDMFILLYVVRFINALVMLFPLIKRIDFF